MSRTLRKISSIPITAIALDLPSIFGDALPSHHLRKDIERINRDVKLLQHRTEPDEDRALS